MTNVIVNRVPLSAQRMKSRLLNLLMIGAKRYQR